MTNCEKKSCNKEGVRDICLNSTIINNEKTLFLKVTQTSSFVLPNSDYEYQIYIKNISPSKIKNIKIFALNQRAIVLDEYEYDDPHYIEQKYRINQLKSGESAYITIKAKVVESGEYNVNFIAYGDNTSLEIVNKKITCGYTKNIPEVHHQISFFNFNPYEESYKLSSMNYNENVTQLQKTQYKPYQTGFQPFPMEKININDIHSFRVYDQQINLINEDDIPITYLGREEYESYIDEDYKGYSLRNLINKINKESDLVNIHFLRTGNNEMDLDFKSIYPTGFLDRFGLLKSEIYHRLGVIPSISYMSDYLFRWAKEDDRIANAIYPPLQDYHWDEKLWNGYGFYVWEYYINLEKNIIESKEIEFFEKREDAELYIERIEEWNNYNNKTRYDDSDNFIEGYFYNIKECLYSEGVFFVNIPMNQIPSNFFYSDIDDLKAIVEKTKPYGMKPIIRYLFNTTFDHQIELNSILKYKNKYSFDLGDYDNIKYIISTKKYSVNDDGSLIFKNNGLSAINWGGFDNENDIKLKKILPQIKKIETPNKDNSLTLENTFETSQLSSRVILDLNKKKTLFSLLNTDTIKDIFFYKDLTLTKGNYFNTNKTLYLYPSNIKKSYKECKQNNDLHYNVDAKRKDICSLKVLDLKSKEYNELSFCFTDKNKDYIVCVEYILEYDKFLVSYKINNNQKIQIVKQFLIEDMEELCCEIFNDSNSNLQNNIMIIIYSKKDNRLSYLTHFNIQEISETNVLLRNTGQITYNTSYPLKYNLLTYENHNSDKFTYTTPDYDICEISDDYIITEKEENKSLWKTLYRINKDEESYALIKANSELEQPNDFQLYLDNINIPEEAIVKSISVKSLTETNRQQQIFISTKANVSYIKSQTHNSLILNPNDINIHLNREDSKYQLEFLSIIDNDNIYKKLLNTNEILNKNSNLDYLDTDNPFVINGDYWTDLNFNNNVNISLNNVENINLVIEGYNDGFDTNIISELCTKSESLGFTISSINNGYFYKKIPLKLNSNIMVSELLARFRFARNLDCIKIFDTKLEITFKNEQDMDITFDNEKQFILENNKTQRFVLEDEYKKGIFYNQGVLINFSFDKLNKNDYIRIYSIELELVYQNQNSRIFIPQSSVDNIIISGNKSDVCYLKGEVFSEMEEVVQTNYEDSINNKYYHGCEIKECIYQSFLSPDDNITSISVKPNGYYGSPSDKLKISILESNNKTPGKVLASCYIDNSRKIFSKNEVVTYPIYVENLTPGNIYWFKIEIVTPKDNSYYWLKSYSKQVLNNKLLYEENGNLYNLEGSLWFSIQSKQNSVYFKDFPKIIDTIQKPYILLTIDKNISQITNLKVREKINYIENIEDINNNIEEVE